VITIKRGKSFRVAFKFEPQEWDSIYPNDYVSSRIKLSDGTYRNIDVTVDAITQALYLRAESADWPLGRAYFDVKVYLADIVLPLPDLENILVNVIEGIS